jgi:hypothetical protein
MTLEFERKHLSVYLYRAKPLGLGLIVHGSRRFIDIECRLFWLWLYMVVER